MSMISSRFYLPGMYLSKVKRPRQHAFQRLLKEDLAIWLLVGAQTPFSFWNVLGLALLFFSMWSIYEIGYYDNDCCAVRYEIDGKVNDAFFLQEGAGLRLKMGASSVIFGLSGVYFTASDRYVEAAISWSVAMASLLLTYIVYNRIDKESRVWLYLPLQLFRGGSVFVIVPALPVAAAVVTAQMLARWIDYIVYRFAKSSNATEKFPKRPQAFTRLLIAILLLAPLISLRKWNDFLMPASLCLPLYVLWASRRDMPFVVRNARRIDA